MTQEQIEQILERNDVPSDVRQILTEYFQQEKRKLVEENRILSAVLETSPVGIINRGGFSWLDKQLYDAITWL
ncbi:MAG: hypothetical protein ACFFC7_29975 [Candidatus Hermodarchaeota archaeon]